MMRQGISILNDVMGPVMRGPSSSHTAGPFFIGKAAREILAQPIIAARVLFDPGGSFARVYRDQSSDAGFAAGLMGLSITEESFNRSLVVAREAGVDISYRIESLTKGESGEDLHPNAVMIEAISVGGSRLRLRAASIGGGQVRVEEVNGTPVQHDGGRVRLLVAVPDCDAADSVGTAVQALGIEDVNVAENPSDSSRNSVLCQGNARSLNRLLEHFRGTATGSAYLLPATALIRYRGPDPLLDSVQAILHAAPESSGGLGQLGLAYEAGLLAMSADEVTALMTDRWRVMARSVTRGLECRDQSMRFLEPKAAGLWSAAGEGRLVCGGLLATASAAALGVMETNSSKGVVCAAPTAGSAGIIPGLLFALQQKEGLTERQITDALFAMGVVGALISTRATFAAEVCGCAAETGVAAAMAAAGLVQIGGGPIEGSLDAAALCLMNTLGLACDPVHGAVEIPCHARNIAGVAHALAATDAVLGGFCAVLPLDEVVDAMLQVGRQMPSALRCTSLGGLAATFTARNLVSRRPTHPA